MTGGPSRVILLGMADLLALCGALATAGLGLLGLVAPARAAAFASLAPVGLVGRSEIRATYGGLFLGLGAVCLVTRAPEALLAAGVAWLGAAAGRLVSVAVDASRSPKNLGGVAFEAAIGLALLAPWIA